MSAPNNRSVRLNGERLKERRRALGLTQQALAEKSRHSVAGEIAFTITVETIKRAERGVPIYLSSATRLAQLLEAPLSELITDAMDHVDMRPAVAVLPFRANDYHDAQLADWLAGDIITHFSRWWFPVVARTSTLGAARVSTLADAKSLGARYWVDGAVSRFGEVVRVTAQVLDTSADQVMARHVYERRLSGLDLVDVPRALSRAIVADLSFPVLDVEAGPLVDTEPRDLDAWHSAILGAWHFHRGTHEDNLNARSLLAAAVQKNPHLPLAWYTLGMTYQNELVHQWTAEPRTAVAALSQLSDEFQRRYPIDARSHLLCAYRDIYVGARNSANSHIAQAIELDPNSYRAYALRGQTFAMAGEPEPSFEQFETALMLSPRDPDRWIVETGAALAHFVAGRYPHSVTHARRAIDVWPAAMMPYAVLATSLAMAGDRDGAKKAAERVRKIQPAATVGGVVAIAGSTNQDILRRFAKGLRLAGIPD